MMAREFDLSPVKFAHLSSRGVLFGLTIGKTTVLGAAVIVLVGSLYSGWSSALLLAAPIGVIAAAAAFVPIAGRPAVDWGPTTGHWLLRVATGQTRYRRPVEHPVRASSLNLPGDASALRQYDDPVTGAVMVHDPHAHTLTVVLNVSHSAFVLQDPAAQQRRVEGFGRVLATACRSGRIARLQVLERTLPDTGAGLIDWWARHGDPTDSFSTRTYRSLIERAGPAAEGHATTVSVALDLTRAARSIRAAGGGMTGAAAVLRQEMDAVAAALRSADLRPAGWCTRGELAAILLNAFDPQAAGTRDQHASSREWTTTTGGPIGVDEHWDRLRTDSAQHAVLWISEWPRTLVYPGFLAPLVLTNGIRRSISITYSPVASSAAIRELRRRRTEHLADRAGRARFGQVDDAHHSAEYNDVLEQEADLAAGHGVLRYSGLVVVTAPDHDQLENAVAAVEQAAVQSSCETRRLVGQQFQSFAAGCLPLARPL